MCLHIQILLAWINVVRLTRGRISSKSPLIIDLTARVSNLHHHINGLALVYIRHFLMCSNSADSTHGTHRFWIVLGQVDHVIIRYKLCLYW